MKIEVQKKNLAGQVTWKYEGVMLSREHHVIVLEAFFNRPDTPFMDIVLKENDRFVEAFYNDRWYNIFKIFDRDDDQIKGWYCNVGMPAVFENGIVSYVDLALDLWVSVDGKQTVLDEDEFNALDLTDETRSRALNGLNELMQVFERKNPPI
jgi:predicted RNA-binding protein associated with RNAse of E/G family